MIFENPITVICIDDDPDICKLLDLYLGKAEMNVCTVTNVATGKELLKKKKFDAIVCDYYMPDGNGIDFLKELRKNNDQIPFVLFTARNCEEVATEALNSGADLLIPKGGILGERSKTLALELKRIILKQREENKTKEDLRKSEEKYRLIAEKLMILGSITRHDISNKLTIIMGYLELICNSDLNGQDREYMKEINSSAKEIKSQIEFAKNYEKVGSMQPTWQIVAELIPPSESKHIALEKNCPGLRVYADPMLSKVFGNLMSNTILHGERVTKINVHHEVRDEGVIIVWEDNGIGIPDNEKEKIFERGFGKNTGLGLFLIREILTITGMAICETGIPGKGARFEIFVPRGKYIIRGGD